MKQAISLLWKDIRHLWPELSVYALLLTVMTVVTPQTWLGREQAGSSLAMFADLLVFLLAVCWLVLITRAVHGDRLAGDEQFWVTRPYTWRSLLGAKLLFVLLCLIAPLVLMQWAMLHAAGLNLLAAKTGMALTLWMFALIAWLPFTVIAAVTESLAMTFTFLAGTLILWVGMLMWILSASAMRTSPPYIFELFSVIFGSTLLAILIYQYSKRRTLYARLASASTLVLFLLLILGLDKGGFGAPVRALIRHYYPVASGGPLHLKFLPGSLRYDERRESPQIPHGYIEVKLPVHIEGVPPNHRLHGASVLVDLRTDHGSYESPWQSVTLDDQTISFLIRENIFGRFANERTMVHLEIAAEELQPARSGTMVVANRFPGPADGVCELIRSRVYCRYAYGMNTPTRIEARPHTGSCDQESLRTLSTISLHMVPEGTKPDPVASQALLFQGQVCPGDSLTFTEYAAGRNLRLLLDIPQIKLAEYRTH